MCDIRPAAQSAAVNAQPFLSEYSRGQVAVAHNGNLINASLLRDEYEAYGHIFKSTCDTEIIIHLLAKPTHIASPTRWAMCSTICRELLVCCSCIPTASRPPATRSAFGRCVSANAKTVRMSLPAKHAHSIPSGQSIFAMSNRAKLSSSTRTACTAGSLLTPGTVRSGSLHFRACLFRKAEQLDFRRQCAFGPHTSGPETCRRASCRCRCRDTCAGFGHVGSYRLFQQERHTVRYGFCPKPLCRPDVPFAKPGTAQTSA